MHARSSDPSVMVVSSLLLFLLPASAFSLRAAAGLRSQISSLAPGSCVLVDVENLRGKSGFRVEHATMVAALARWTREWELDGRVVLAFDHGSQRCGFYLPPIKMGVIFSGPRDKADDVLVECVRSAPGSEALVVTADGELRSRCRRAARRRLSIASPFALLQALFPEQSARGSGGTGETAATAAASSRRHSFEREERARRVALRHERELRRQLPALRRQVATLARQLDGGGGGGRDGSGSGGDVPGAMPEKKRLRLARQRASLAAELITAEQQLASATVAAAAATAAAAAAMAATEAAGAGPAASDATVAPPGSFEDALAALTSAGPGAGGAGAGAGLVDNHRSGTHAPFARRERTAERILLAEALRLRLDGWRESPERATAGRDEAEVGRADPSQSQQRSAAEMCVAQFG